MRHYFAEISLTTRPKSDVTAELNIHSIRDKTKNPAKMVRNGGPWASSLLALLELFSSLMEFPSVDFEAAIDLCLNSNPMMFFLYLYKRNHISTRLSKYCEYKYQSFHTLNS